MEDKGELWKLVNTIKIYLLFWKFWWYWWWRSNCLSIEIKPEKGQSKWYKEVKYTCRGDLQKDIDDVETTTRKRELLNQDTILKDLNEMNLVDLKNNYSTRPSYFSYWKLEYNDLYKIVGSANNQPEEIEKIVEILDVESEVKQIMNNE